MKRNLYIFILAALFLGVARLLNGVNFWHLIGVPHPHGYEIQGLLFLTTLFVLQNFLFEPYLTMLEERDNMTVHKKEQAEKTKLEADQMLANYQKSIADTRVKATLERERIALNAESDEREKISVAKKEGSILAANAATQLEGETKKVRGELAGQVEQLAQEIMNRVSAGSNTGRGQGVGTPMFVAGKE